jgi:hypothetical protein
MGAYDELATTGRAGEQTTELLRQLVLATVQARGFVPPAPHAAWTADAVDETVAQLVGAAGTGFLLTCWARAEDDATLAAVTADVVGSLLEEAGTGWSVAEVARRLDAAVLPGDPDLVRTSVPTGWGLPGQARWDPVRRSEVVAALAAVAVRTRGRDGVATVPVLRALGHVALRAAGGAMTTAELAGLVVDRLAPPRRRPPRPLLMDGVGESVSPLLDGPEPGLVVNDTAEEIWASLTSLERTLVPHLGLPVAELAAVAELPGAMAEVAADGLVERLRAACADDERAAEVLVRLRVLCTERP